MVVRSSGFLLLEVAITIALISGFFTIFTGYLCQIGSWQAQARVHIEATNCASSCFELLRYQSFPTHNNFILSVKKEQLSYPGRWYPSLDSQELDTAQDHFQFVIVTVEWETDRKYLCTFLSGEMIK